MSTSRDRTTATRVDRINHQTPVETPIKSGRNIELFPESTNTVDYNLIRKAVRFYSTNIFSIGPAIHRMYFKEFFLLYWEGDYIISQSKDKQGFLNRNGKQYEIVYKTPLTRGKILYRLDNQFALSFREPFADYKLPNVVIISAGRNGRNRDV